MPLESPPVDRAVALVSGGLDSCVAAVLARRSAACLAVLHVSYGQRTQGRERRAFEAIADHLRADDRLIVDVDYLRQIGGSSLTDPSMAIPGGEPDSTEVPSTYVPFRNANLLAIAVAWAESLKARAVTIGIHREGAAYPDCRPAFFEAYNRMVAQGTRPDSGIQVQAPLLDMDKVEIVRLGTRIDAPFHLTWSCYSDEERPCGTCHSCRMRRAGFDGAGVPDPLVSR